MSFTLILLLLGLFVVVAGVIIFIVFVSKLEGTEEPAPLPYKAKLYFFTKSEQEFVRILNQSIDRQKYTIFPKVRLADIVEVDSTPEEYQAWWNKIRSKHIDFVIWDFTQSKIVLAIELDGKSHQKEKMIESDNLKDKIFERVGINLARVKVGSTFADEIEKLIIDLPNQ